MDGVEDVGQPGLGIKAVHLCRLNERHGAGQRFAAAALSSEQPVLPVGTDRAHRALGGVVVDAGAAILEEQFEG